MELLKRFEESNAEEADLGDEDEEDDPLVQRLKGVDLGTPRLESHPLPSSPTDVSTLDSVSPEDLWNLLPDEERAKFLKTMEDPSSDLREQLLADGGLLHKQFKPWWRNREDPTVKCPTMMSIPRSLVGRMPSDGPALLYNICAVWWGPLHLSNPCG